MDGFTGRAVVVGSLVQCLIAKPKATIIACLRLNGTSFNPIPRNIGGNAEAEL